MVAPDALTTGARRLISFSIIARSSAGVFWIGLGADFRERGFHVFGRHRLRELRVQLVDDRLGRARRCEDARVDDELEAGKPDSIIVGTSPTAGTRFADVIASPRILPAAMFETAGGIERNEKFTSFASTACAEGVLPLYGT